MQARGVAVTAGMEQTHRCLEWTAHRSSSTLTCGASIAARTRRGGGRPRGGGSNELSAVRAGGRGRGWVAAGADPIADPALEGGDGVAASASHAGRATSDGVDSDASHNG